MFLQNNIHNRQVSAFTDEVLNFACFNTQSFRDYFRNCCMKIAQNTEVDGFFWDEPHYAYPKSYASITGGAGDDWSCRCPVCKKKFEEYYGYEMPRIMNDDVKQFRWREAMVILRETSKALKEYNPALEITCCVHATLNTYYVTELRGYDNWDLVASCPYFDVFSTTIISWDLPEKFLPTSPNARCAWQKNTTSSRNAGLWGITNRPKTWRRWIKRWICMSRWASIVWRRGLIAAGTEPWFRRKIRLRSGIGSAKITVVCVENRKKRKKRGPDKAVQKRSRAKTLVLKKEQKLKNKQAGEER